MEKQHFSILLTIIGLLHFSHGCSIDGINWFVPETRVILDTYRGNVFSSSTQNIQAINDVRQGEGLNEGPYIIATLKDSMLIIDTDTAFENYEKIETETTLRYTITLTCSDGSTRNLIFIIEVTDTNNNDPVFLPTSNYEFTIAPPVPPGFVVTTCLNDILVRDIDLTTYSIDFKIEGSDLFEISFDPSSKVPKEFKAKLKTTNLIRSLTEPVKLTVTATDVDLTEEPPRTATATVVIAADSQFQFPDEPIFSQPFYLATYKSNNDLILQDNIFLRQGYDGLVKFTFEGDHSEYFDFVVNQNSISFNMKAPIPIDLYDENQIYLIVKATREHTSGATATVIVKLPEDTRLEFENAVYEGTIINNVLQLTDLKLKQGYEGFNITVDIESEYAFRASVESNVIKISMDPLATDVIENNNFINLQITASNNRSTAVTIVVLEIIKNDYTTPVFEYNFYSGSYSTERGLTLQQIILTQGYDETVKITLEGEHSKYFQTNLDGPRITLTSLTIPTDIFNERNIIITVLASKPRTVGAHATVNIELPSARYLDFEKNIYEGTIENNILILSNIVLMDGYASDVNFTLEGEFMTYFSIKEQQNVVTIEIEKVIPENVVLENDILVLTLNAIGANAFDTSTSIVLKIIKDDHQTPMFSEKLYSLKYENDELSLGNITLVQGFDDTVTFELIGDHKEYFLIEPSLNIIKLLLKSSIPEDVIFNNKIIILNIVAQKPRTVGANAAVYITFPQEMIEPTVMSFALNAYNGLIKGSSLTVDDIVLEPGYTPQTEFILSGEYSEYFKLHNSSNVVKLIPASDKSLEDLKDNNVIILEVKATRERAISAVTVVVIDILKTVIVPPVFEKAFYTGAYTSSKGLLFDELITLELGFDSTVTFGLEEEFSKWFKLEQSESSVTLKVNATNPIPEEILENNLHLFFTVIASKPEAVTGRAVIYIDLPKDETAPIILQFEKRQYLGIIENRALELEIIRLLDADISFVQFNLTGEFSKYFTISKLTDGILIYHEDLPKEVIENNTVIILNVEASQISAISGHATIVLEIIRSEEQIIIPVFEEAFYTGQYSNKTGLVFSSTIKLVQGFDETVSFDLIEEDAKWFSLIHNGPNDLSLQLKDEGLNEITGRSNLIFTVVANKTNSLPALSAVIISLQDNNDLRVLQFEQKTYVGRIENQILHLENLRLLEESISSIEFEITGDYASYFKISKSSDFIQINLLEPPSEMIEDNDFVILNLEASELGAISGHTTIVVEIVKDEVQIKKPIFNEIYYTGEYSQESELNFPTSITLIQGYDETVSFELEDDDSQWFSLVQNVPNTLTLKIKNDSINEITGRSHLIFTVAAHKANSTSAHAAIVISLINNNNVRILNFEQTSYLGNLENKMLEIEEIDLLSGITSTMEFIIIGDYASYFSVSKLVDSVQINLVEFSAELTDNNDFIILNLKVSEPGAVSGHTTIVVDIVKNEEHNTVTPVFSEAYYTGQYSKENGLVFLSVITLIQGYDETVTFTLDNDDSKAFALVKNGLNNFTLILDGSLSEEVNKNYFLFTVIADKPNTNNGQAAIVISLTEPPENEDVSFDRILYNGKLENGVLSHDEITLSGFEGTNIKLTGEHSALFTSELSNGVVKVKASGADFPSKLNYILLELQAASANAILVIDVSYSDPPENEDVSFDRILYNGKLENGVLSHDEITLSGFEGTNIQIKGEHSALFTSELSNGVVKVKASGADFPSKLNYISLELQAASAKAILLIDVSFSENEDVSFDRILYNGQLENGVLSHDEITLSGFKGTNIQIKGEHNALFTSELSNGVVKVKASGADFPSNLNYILLELQAASANAILLIDVSYSDPPGNEDVSFDRILYNGKLENGVLSHDEITLSGFEGTNIKLTGEHSALFTSELSNGVVKVKASGAELPSNLNYILLELQAASANAILLIDVSYSDPPENEDVSFDRILYNGKLENGVLSHDEITLSGFEGTNIKITGEHNALFTSELKNGVVKVEASGAEFPRNLTYILLELQAASANAILLIDVSFSEPPENEDVSFDRILYNGKLENGVLSHDEITLSGFEGTNIQIKGEHSALFTSELSNGVVKVKASGADFPKNLNYISLELQAASANAILLIDVSFSGNEDVSFDQILYNGKLENGVLSHDEITLSGFEGTNIQIKGEHSALFTSELSNGIVKVEASGADFPSKLNYILLELQAASANAILLIDVSFSDPPGNEDVFFDRILYNGKFENGVLSHDEITLSGFEGTNIEITGEHSALFTSELSNGVVKVKASGTDFPSNLNYILLELQAASANAILLIDVSYSDNPQPIVSFKSQSYFLWADVEQTGVVGAVEATANNGEAVIYSLSEHIESQININSNGEIYLTSAFDKGVYKFNAVATSVQSQVQGTAPVLLRVDTLPECSNELGLSPLIILERLEEEPHRNLVILNQTEHKGCKYLLTNVFPKDQSWLYLHNDGLHTKAIDREDASIAFMTLSQIQVELTLDCDSDEVPTFAKRSLGTGDESDLYSYDDGPNKWVLTDTILFNARRSFVNLIVKDINDNSPIFLGKGNEPIYVGYPVSELEGTVLPRSLAELKAIDADIGENAAITYSSLEDNLAVSPSTGLVHVRNNAQLENDSRLTIYAIDQNGKGRSGTIDIVVKLLDKNQIIVMTVRDAFLEDEVDVVKELSIAVGYEIKVLRAVVIPNNNEELSRRKRDVDSNSQASLQLYAYGLLESEPVDINQLTRDINNINIATVNIATIVSLEDHLEGLEICTAPGRDTGLLAATIVLAVLLFIAIVAIAVKFLLKWKTFKNYHQFSNRNSSVSQSSSPNLPKIEVIPKLRPDIDEIKRTERRLQEMLETPIENVPARQAGGNVKPPIETVHETRVNISSADAQIPIVIQSIDKLKDKTDESDDNDEFGEVKKPRKSVVTFNENVEKIIHIEDVPDDNSSENNFEISKF